MSFNDASKSLLDRLVNLILKRSNSDDIMDKINHIALWQYIFFLHFIASQLDLHFIKTSICEYSNGSKSTNDSSSLNENCKSNSFLNIFGHHITPQIIPIIFLLFCLLSNLPYFYWQSYEKHSFHPYKVIIKLQKFDIFSKINENEEFIMICNSFIRNLDNHKNHKEMSIFKLFLISKIGYCVVNVFELIVIVNFRFFNKIHKRTCFYANLQYECTSKDMEIYLLNAAFGMVILCLTLNLARLVYLVLTMSKHKTFSKIASYLNLNKVERTIQKSMLEQFVAI